MKNISVALPELFKRSLKHYVGELKNRDDYEAKMDQVECEGCGGEAETPKYRIEGESDWKLAYEGREILCKECSDSKEISKIFEGNKVDLREQLSRRFEEEYWQVPDALKYAGFKNFKVNAGESVLAAKQAGIKYVGDFLGRNQKNEVRRYNLLFMGLPGTGKSHLAVAIARTLKEKGFITGFISTASLLTKIYGTFNSGASKTKEDIFRDLSKFELLVLDDIGYEGGKKKDEDDYSKQVLFEIVDTHRAGKPTIYTSNFNEEHLPMAVGSRVFSRLNNNTKFVELVTDDFRKNYRIG